jgi:hypothetical protein
MERIRVTKETTKRILVVLGSQRHHLNCLLHASSLRCTVKVVLTHDVTDSIGGKIVILGYLWYSEL